jgi:hypothetical protein
MDDHAFPEKAYIYGFSGRQLSAAKEAGTA